MPKPSMSNIICYIGDSVQRQFILNISVAGMIWSFDVVSHLSGYLMDSSG